MSPSILESILCFCHLLLWSMPLVSYFFSPFLLLTHLLTTFSNVVVCISPLVLLCIAAFFFLLSVRNLPLTLICLYSKVAIITVCNAQTWLAEWYHMGWVTRVQLASVFCPPQNVESYVSIWDLFWVQTSALETVVKEFFLSCSPFQIFIKLFQNRPHSHEINSHPYSCSDEHDVSINVEVLVNSPLNRLV